MAAEQLQGGEGTRSLSPVYVMSPIGYRTGGPEALHQLVHSLNTQGYSAALTPYDVGRNTEPVPQYQVYGCAIENLPEDGDRFQLVLPELRLKSPLGQLERVLNNPDVDVWIWWLSVDNSQHPGTTRFGPRQLKRRKYGLAKSSPRNPISLMRENKARKDEGRQIQGRLDLLMDRGAGFLAQSEYALDFCARALGREAHLVTDYLGAPSIHRQPEVRVNQIAYNGIKSGSFVDELSSYLSDFKLKAIKGMSPEEVAETLAASVAYVELGPLPGRDRLPREASRLGTPVVMLCRGAGQYAGDFPLPDQYRIPFNRGWAKDLANRVRHVAEGRAEAQADQAVFRRWVLTDRDRFDDEVTSWVSG